MVTTVFVVVATHDLSLGVLGGVLLSGIFFAAKVQRMFSVEREADVGKGAIACRVVGQILFASVNRFSERFRRLRPRHA